TGRNHSASNSFRPPRASRSSALSRQSSTSRPPVHQSPQLRPSGKWLKSACKPLSRSSPLLDWARAFLVVLLLRKEILATNEHEYSRIVTNGGPNGSSKSRK